MNSLDYITVSDSTMEIENQGKNSASGNCLFKTQCVPYSGKWRQRNPIRKFVHLKVFKQEIHPVTRF